MYDLSQAIWFEKKFLSVLLFFFIYLSLLSITFIVVGRKKTKNLRGWASIKSWWITLPITFFFFGLPYPASLILLTLISISATKTFFQMTGMFHRSAFVWSTYLFIITSACVIYLDRSQAYSINWLHIYNLLPMFYLACLGLIPILTNTTKHMIQYMGLSLMGFSFLGWSFLHLGHIINLDDGIYILIYLFMLTECSESFILLVNRYFPTRNPFSNITSTVSIEGTLVSIILTTLLAWGFRHMLPDRSEQYWIMASIITIFFGAGGHLIMSVIRKDLGIKDTGVFILGKNDLLARLNKLIFVGPYFYYSYILLQKGHF